MAKAYIIPHPGKGNSNAVKDFKVEIKNNGCHECTSHTKISRGYVYFRYNKKATYLHRYIASQKYEEIDHRVVRHLCHNPSCCNPDHLAIGTLKDNSKDKISNKTYGTKLTPSDAREIYSDTRSYSVIAEAYNITKGMVGHIKTKRSWKLLHE